ncbi:MAG: alpha/beta fold hydrolase [Planctomycetota bacterium]
MTEPHLILLPGMDGTGRLFAPLLRELGVDATVLAHPADRPLDYDALLEDVARHLPPGPLVVLGESFSGPLAVRLAAERDDIVGLVLCATFVRGPRSGALLRLAELVARGAPPAPVVRALLAGFDAPRALVDEVRSAVATLAPGVLRARLRAVRTVDVSSVLAATTCPVLDLRATHDRLVGASARRDVLRARPDAEAQTLGSPHLVAQRRPAEVAALLRAFVERCR